MRIYVVEQQLVTTRELLVWASSKREAEDLAKDGRYDEMVTRPGKLSLLTTVAREAD